MSNNDRLVETPPFSTPEGRNWLISHLKMGPVNVTFLKKDGSKRVMNCTLEESVIPVQEKSSDAKERKVNEEVIPVYDLDKKEWRSFRLDSILTVSFTL